MKKIFIALFCWFLLGACCPEKNEASPPEKPGESPENGKGEPPQAVYRKITQEEAKGMMGEAKGFVLLDVRTEEEHREQRIPGSVLLPYDEIIDRAEEKLPDKGALIFVYCRSGRRSETAARGLVDLGYTNVYDIGGILDWTYETENG